jgi:hypothetical protein
LVKFLKYVSLAIITEILDSFNFKDIEILIYHMN